MVKWEAVVLAILVALPLPTWAREPRQDPSTKNVRVLYLGDAWGTDSPVFQINKDPIFKQTGVPASETAGPGVKELRKLLRIYMPRSYSIFVSQYDLVVLSDTQSVFFTHDQLMWFKNGVESEGLGILMAGGRDIQQGQWSGTSVEDALPATFMGTLTHEMPFRAVIVNPDHEFVKALPLDKLPLYLGMNVVSPREGTEVILRSQLEGYPILVYRDFGRGAGVFHTPDWTPAWGGYLSAWEYYGDFVCNLLYLSAGLSVPQDPLLMHTLRELFGDFDVRRGMIVSLANFIDEFGASTVALDRKLAELDAPRAQASSLYRDQDYEGTLALIRQLIRETDNLQAFALKLKDRAMVWIYVTEVSAVTGTSLVCGAVLWLLMVKRRLYREVAVTRSPGTPR